MTLIFRPCQRGNISKMYISCKRLLILHSMKFKNKNNYFIRCRITFGASPNEMSRTPADHRMPSNENSMLMNALAMKYLPCDLNNTSSPQSSRNGVIHATATNTRSAPTTPLNPIPNSRPIRFDNKHSNTDMSITSYRYMEKYGLL